MSQPISNIAVGSLVRDHNSKYLGAPIVWKIAAHNFAGYPANSTTLISDKTLTRHAEDGKKSEHDRSNNRYKFSNIRQWLNTSSSAPWWVAQHPTDAEPSDANTYEGVFGYNDEAGFMANLSVEFANSLFETPYSVRLSREHGGGTEILTDKIFLPSIDEVGDGSSGNFPIFSTSDTSRTVFSTAEYAAYCNAENGKKDPPGKPIEGNLATDWWLRDSHIYTEYCQYEVYSNGDINAYGDAWEAKGVRPLCNINSSIRVSNTADADGVYDIEFIGETEPYISGVDTDLGEKTADFAYSYTVYDDNFADGDIVIVVEKLNGATMQTYSLTKQETREFTVAGETFLRLGNTSHTLEITVTDGQGGTATRTVTFTKQQSISLTLAEALPNNGDQAARPVEASAFADAYVPTGATLSVEVCNNGFDVAPTWEDCTIEAVNGQKYTFANETKTADRWGVNVRVNIAKGTATKTPELSRVLLKFKY